PFTTSDAWISLPSTPTRYRNRCHITTRSLSPLDSDHFLLRMCSNMRAGVPLESPTGVVSNNPDQRNIVISSHFSSNPKCEHSFLSTPSAVDGPGRNASRNPACVIDETFSISYVSSQHPS